MVLSSPAAAMNDEQPLNWSRRAESAVLARVMATVRLLDEPLSTPSRDGILRRAQAPAARTAPASPPQRADPVVSWIA